MKGKEDQHDHYEALLREDHGPVVPPPSADADEGSEEYEAQRRLHLMTATLTRLKALLFEPPESDLSDEEVEQKVEHLMKLTESIRPRAEEKRERRILSLPSRAWPVLAAASVLIAVGIAMIFVTRPGPPGSRVAYLLDGA